MATAKRKDPKRVAAAKRAAATRRRNAAKPSRRRTTKKGLLSEMFNPKMAQGAAKSTLSGAVGGAGAVGLFKLMPNATPIQKGLAGAAGSFVLATLLKMPNTGAGVMGGTVALSMQEAGMLNEGMSAYNYSRGIEALPMVLNEDGEEMYLQEGEEMYLQEDADMYLQEDYSVGYYGYGFGG